MSTQDHCPLCDNGKSHFAWQGSTGLYLVVVCPTHGAWGFTEAVESIVTDNSPQGRDIRRKLGQLLVEKRLKDKFERFRQYGTSEGVADAELLRNALIIIDNNAPELQGCSLPQIRIGTFLNRFPSNNMAEILERSLCNIARYISLPDNYSWSLSFSRCPTAFFDLCFSQTSQFPERVYQNLVEAGWINAEKASDGDGQITLTFAGWKKFEDILKSKQESNTAFVAMWFDDSNKLLKAAAKAAIEQAGYEAIVLDDFDHNNFIMDEVINQIGEAKFVIADFTCIPEQPEENSKIPGGVRGGVYFEAGYAKGLGKEVIFTCKDSEEARKRRHFDIDQVNFLFWQENSGKLVDRKGRDFIERLTERIKATVGPGENLPQN